MGELGWLDILKGAGSILQAGATAWTGKETNKLQKEVLNYQKEQDKLDENRLNQTQANLDTAVTNVYGTEEKKKKPLTTTTDLSLSYGTPSTVM